jgi:hypothetical protein
VLGGIKNFAAGRGFSAIRHVPTERALESLKKLHPVNTDRPLIRVGASGDGGYLVPDDLEGLAGCFSPGVDVTAKFEADMIARGVPCYLADASVTQAPIEHDLIHFDAKFLGVVDSANTITLDTWVRQYAGTQSGDLILQMDIEGAEWATLLNTSDECLRRFRIIVLELHGLPRLLDPFSLSIIDGCIERLTRDFYVVHSHPNNSLKPLRIGTIEIPYTAELTLYRKDRAKTRGFATHFPHPLDSDNDPSRPSYTLPTSMYHAGR